MVKNQDALVRLKRIEGQVRGIIQMIEEDRYCMDVLMQISAVQAALRKTQLSLSQNHLDHCLTEAIQEGNSDQVITEFHAMMKYMGR